MKQGAVTLLGLALALALASCSDDPSSLSGGRRSSTGGTSGATSSGDPSGTSSGDPSGTSSGASGTAGGSAAEICVATINEYRKTKGLAPYGRWSEMESCADGQATTDATTSRPHGAFGKCSEAGQNECPGWQGPAEKMIPQCLKAMWGEGPGGGHYEAMANPRYTKVACGFGTAPNGGIWSVQNFR